MSEFPRKSNEVLSSISEFCMTVVGVERVKVITPVMSTRESYYRDAPALSSIWAADRCTDPTNPSLMFWGSWYFLGLLN